MSELWSVIIPVATINELTNPSFELGTTGWSTGGSNTIAQSSDQSFKGIYSCKATYQTSTTLLTITSVTLTQNARSYLHGRVYVPSNWDGGNIRASFANYSGASPTYSKIWTAGTDPTGTWILIITYLDNAADATGDILFETTSAPTAGRYVYFDALMLEQQDSAYTTYCDGDQDGCEWDGAKHDSTSSRPLTTRAGGLVKNFSDYGLKVVGMQGIGMAFSQHKTQTSPSMDGATFLGSKVEPRTFLLTCKLAPSGSTGVAKIADLHDLRQDVVDALKADLVYGAQPFILQYTGASTEAPVEIECVYDGGLEFGNLGGFIETIPLRLRSYSPFFAEVKEGGAVIDCRDIFSHYYILGRVDGSFTNLANGMNDDVRALVFDQDNLLYAGGDFTTAGGSARYRIASWDGSSWSAVGAGLNDIVRALALGPSNYIYAGGDFTDVQGGGGGTYNYIVQWTGSAYSDIGGTSATVRAITTHPDGSIYVGGDFTSVDGGGTTAYRVAIYDIADDSWSNLGTANGLNDIVRAIAIDDDGIVYIGGDFTDVQGGGGGTYNYIVKYDPDTDTFEAMGTGMNNSVYALAIAKDGTVYAGGTFSTAGGTTANKIAKWNGTTWLPLAAGVPAGNVYALHIDQNGLLYLGGNFYYPTHLNGGSAFVAWNGSSFVFVDILVPTENYAILTLRDDIYIGLHQNASSDTAHINTITNEGSAKTYPTVYIRRATGGGVGILRPDVCQLKNWDTNATVWFDYRMLPGEVLTVDFTPGARALTSSLLGDVSKGIHRGSDFSNFYLLPGENRIGALFTQLTDVTSTITWSTRHWSADRS